MEHLAHYRTSFRAALSCKPFTPSIKRRIAVSRSVSTQNAVPTDPAPGLKPLPWTNTPEQQQALQQLRQRLGGGAPDDATLMWYLRDRYFDVEEAEQKLRAMMKWRAGFRPSDLSVEAVAREMARGKAYVHQHTDRYGRPVIVVRVKRHVIGEYPLEDSKRLCTHLLDEAIAALPPGEEQIIGIFDLQGFDLRNADVPFAAFLVEAFFDYYPRRVAQVLMVDAPWIFSGPWELIRPLLRKYAALVQFVSREEVAQTVFIPETIPADFK